MLRGTLRVSKWTCKSLVIFAWVALESNWLFLNFGASDNTGFTQSWKNSNIVKTLFGLFIFSFHMVSQIISQQFFLSCNKIFKQPVLTEWRFERSKYSDAFILRALNFVVKFENYYFFTPRVGVQPLDSNLNVAKVPPEQASVGRP